MSKTIRSPLEMIKSNVVSNSKCAGPSSHAEWWSKLLCQAVGAKRGSQIAATIIPLAQASVASSMRHGMPEGGRKCRLPEADAAAPHAARKTPARGDRRRCCVEPTPRQCVDASSVNAERVNDGRCVQPSRITSELLFPPSAVPVHRSIPRIAAIPRPAVDGYNLGSG